MADLHTTLVAKVTAHLELAQAARDATAWHARGTCWTGIASESVAHIRANDPEHAIRVCRADLERLEEHAPESSRMPGFHCAQDWADGNGWISEWPCPEVRAIAAAYGVDLDELSHSSPSGSTG